MKINTVFIVGPPRTGTSVLTMCLKNSGYNIGKWMLGHKYPSQDRFFMTANRKITRLLIKQVVESKQDLKKPIVIGDAIKKEIEKLWRYVALYRVDALKDPLLYEIFGVYFNVDPIFRQQKFIWTHRDPIEAAKSAVRLKRLKNVPEGSPLTGYDVKTRLNKIYAYNNIHETYFSRCDGINVYFEDLISDPENTGKELSDFLGRKIDMSLINRKETFEACGKPQ